MTQNRKRAAHPATLFYLFLHFESLSAADEVDLAVDPEAYLAA
jgi:hypothetical protein